MRKLEVGRVGTRVEVAMNGGVEFIGRPTAKIIAYDDPEVALADAAAFFRAAIEAWEEARDAKPGGQAG